MIKYIDVFVHVRKLSVIDLLRVVQSFSLTIKTTNKEDSNNIGHFLSLRKSINVKTLKFGELIY